MKKFSDSPQGWWMRNLVLFNHKILGANQGVVSYAKITFLNFNQRAKGKSVARNA
jgi:hypothetical protein